MYRSLFPRDIFAEMDRLQRDLQQALDPSPTIRGFGRGGFPALNVGSAPQAVEVYAFAPGLDPASVDVIAVEGGLLTISGSRTPPLPDEGSPGDRAGGQAAVHNNERFAGEFRRVVTLPDDVDVDAVEARYRDGVIQITIPRRASARPRRIEIQ